MATATTCTALLALLLFGLGFYVSIERGRTKTNIGSSTDPTDPLYRAVRAHGNAAEYCPMLAALFLANGFQGPGGVTVAIFWVAVVARFVHVIGMTTGPALDTVNPLRFVGALFTYLSGAALALALLV